MAVVPADDAVMGGPASEEFVAPVANGSDRLVHCSADGCRWAVTDWGSVAPADVPELVARFAADGGASAFSCC